MTQRIGPQSTPVPIRIAGFGNNSSQPQNMQNTGWVCSYEIKNSAGAVMAGPQPIIETILVNGVNHFNVEMTIAHADLLLANANGDDAEFFWNVKVANTIDPYQSTHTERLLVSVDYARVAPEVGENDEYWPHDSNQDSTTGVQFLTIAKQEAATGPADSNGRPTATGEKQKFSHDEVNRIMQVGNANADILNKHLLNHETTGPENSTLTFRL